MSTQGLPPGAMEAPPADRAVIDAFVAALKTDSPPRVDYHVIRGAPEVAVLKRGIYIMVPLPEEVVV